jgi:hypothetical protein
MANENKYIKKLLQRNVANIIWMFHM